MRALTPLLLMSAVLSLPLQAAPLNDTGLDQCSTGVQLEACSEANTGDGTTQPRQDARFGRDAQAGLGQLTKTGGGEGGFDFTPLDASGAAIAVDGEGLPETTPACVLDNTTKLVWEVKINPSGSLQTGGHRYTWYNGTVGTPDGGDNCLNPTRCDTQKFVEDVNTAGLCGYNSGWRLPTRRELLSLIHYGTIPPAIDSGYFVSSVAQFTWTSDPNAANPATEAWMVEFGFGDSIPQAFTEALAVRVVRDAP